MSAVLFDLLVLLCEPCTVCHSPEQYPVGISGCASCEQRHTHVRIVSMHVYVYLCIYCMYIYIYKHMCIHMFLTLDIRTFAHVVRPSAIRY